MPESPTGFRYGGFRFDDDKSRWVHASSEAASDVLGRPLRLATLNCLHDHGDAELLQHERRYDASCASWRHWRPMSSASTRYADASSACW